jgi:NodT family efflux transporter outer membrane factor (OMF) lipoprotein
MNRILKTVTKLIPSAVIVGTLMAGCAVGPDYKQPKTELLPFHNLPAISLAKPGPAPSLDKWWTDFNDPVLVTIVQRALDQNLDLAASLARVKEARALASGASAQLFPTLDLGGGANYEHQSLRNQLGTIAGGLPTYSRNIAEYNVGPAASWEVDLFGGLRRSEAAARAEAQAAVAGAIGTRVIVAADAADAYFQIRGYQARLAVAQNQIENDEHLLKLVRDRYNAGAAQGLEIAQADALLKQARASIPPLRVALEKQMNRLDVLLGEQPGNFARTLAPSSEIASIPSIFGDEKPVDVLRRRPDIIAAERLLAASNERIGAAISDYYPKISLSGALGFDSLSANKMFTSKAFDAVGGGALRWRIFDFGKVNAEVAQAKGANAEALALYKQSVLRAAEDVENSLMLLTQTQIHVQELQDQVEALRKARDLSEQAYRAGSITLTDVLDANRELLGGQDELDANRADAARAAVAVYRAFGGGWDAPAVQTAKQ